MHSQQPPDPTRPHAQAGSADADGTPSTLVSMHADKPLPYPSVTDHPSHCGQPMAAPGEEKGTGRSWANGPEERARPRV
jgi:hypothetical protein